MAKQRKYPELQYLPDGKTEDNLKRWAKRVWAFDGINTLEGFLARVESSFAYDQRCHADNIAAIKAAIKKRDEDRATPEPDEIAFLPPKLQEEAKRTADARKAAKQDFALEMLLGTRNLTLERAAEVAKEVDQIKAAIKARDAAASV